MKNYVSKVRITKTAKEKIKKIYFYSVENFGKDRAVKYVNGLIDCCNSIPCKPYSRKILTPAEGILIEGEEFGYISYESHFIYYSNKKTDGVLYITDILHQAQLQNPSLKT